MQPVTFFSGGNGGTEGGGEGPRTPQPVPGGAHPRPPGPSVCQALAVCPSATTAHPEGGLCVCVLCRCSCVRLFGTPWTVARQAPLSVGFFRQEDRSGLPCPSPECLLDPGMEPRSPALHASSLPPSHRESPQGYTHTHEQLSSLTMAATLAPAQLREAGSRISGGWVSAGAVSVSRAGSLRALREFSPSS